MTVTVHPLYEDIKRLREDEGLTYREIAERLGISLKHAHTIYHDPDLARERERKEKYAGVCVDCGARTSGRTGGGRPVLRCWDCGIAHSKSVDARLASSDLRRGRSRRWTDRDVLDAIQGLAYREDPTAAAYQRLRASLPAGMIPSLPSILLRFGTWNAALVAAGVDVTHHRHPYRTRFDRGVALGAIRRCADEIGKIPSAHEYDAWARGREDAPSQSRARQLVGGWGEAIRIIAAERGES